MRPGWILTGHGRDSSTSGLLVLAPCPTAAAASAPCGPAGHQTTGTPSAAPCWPRGGRGGAADRPAVRRRTCHLWQGTVAHAGSSTCVNNACVRHACMHEFPLVHALYLPYTAAVDSVWKHRRAHVHDVPRDSTSSLGSRCDSLCRTMMASCTARYRSCGMVGRPLAVLPPGPAAPSLAPPGPPSTWTGARAWGWQGNGGTVLVNVQRSQ